MPPTGAGVLDIAAGLNFANEQAFEQASLNTTTAAEPVRSPPAMVVLCTPSNHQLPISQGVSGCP